MEGFEEEMAKIQKMREDFLAKVKARTAATQLKRAALAAAQAKSQIAQANARKLVRVKKTTLKPALKTATVVQKTTVAPAVTAKKVLFTTPAVQKAAPPPVTKK